MNSAKAISYQLRDVDWAEEHTKGSSPMHGPLHSSFRPVLLVATVLLILCESAHAQQTDSSRAQQTDMEIVKSRVHASLSSSPNAATISNYQTTLKPDGRWPDVVYKRGDSKCTEHLNRVISMAKMYVFGSMKGNAALRDDILRAYDAWITLAPNSANWWYNEIKWPRSIAMILMLMKDQMSADQLASGLKIAHRAFNGTTGMTGANLVDRAHVGLMEGLVANDPALVKTAFGRMSSTVAVQNWFYEGIQPDLSFAQHGKQLYGGGYGTVYIKLICKYAEFGAGTSYGFSDKALRVLTDYLLDGLRYVVRGDGFAEFHLGRKIVNPRSAGTADYLPRILKQAVASCKGYREAELRAFYAEAKAVKAAGEAVPAHAISGNRNFWAMDTMSHHRSEGAIFVNTLSKRTVPPEGVKRMNLKGLHLADGFTPIKRTGNEYDNIMPVWNWYRLPGTTVEQNGHKLEPWGRHTSKYAGGVSDGVDGAAVFDYGRLGVSAKKSWFFMDRAMVALGADVSAPSSKKAVLTTVNQSLLAGNITYKAGKTTSKLSGTASPGGLEWVNHDGIGYFFPKAVSNATIAGVTQSGRYRDIHQSMGKSMKNDSVSKDVFSLYLDHGKAFKGSSYAYVVVPGLTPADMDGYDVGDLQILSNTATVQAVKSLKAGLTLANFHAPGTVDGITVSHACSLIVRDDGDTFAVTASDPTQALAGDLTIEIARSSAGLVEADGEVTVKELQPRTVLRINMGESTGRSLTAKFFTTPGAYRKVVLSPVADSSVVEKGPTTNHGTSPDLAIKSDNKSGDWSEFYLKFDLSGVTGTPVAARLILNPTSVSKPDGLHMVAPVADNGWSETGVTWATKPAIPDSCREPLLVRTGRAVRADVLYAVQKFKSDKNELSLCVASFTQRSGIVKFASREHKTADLRPALELVFSTTPGRTPRRDSQSPSPEPARR